jgi:Sulfatase
MTTANSHSPRGPTSRSEWRVGCIRGAVHFAVLWSFAIAQPLFEVLAEEAAFFVARNNTRGDILLLAIGLVVLPPAAFLAVSSVARRLAGPSALRGLQLIVFAILAVAFALQIVEAIVPGLPLAAIVSLSIFIAGAATFAYGRQEAVRSVLTALAPAPVIFLGLFLLVSPVSTLVLPQETASAGGGGDRAESPVVMIIFDELPVTSLQRPDRRIDQTRYPGFGQLGRDGTWYRDAVTVDFSTTRAVPAALTGMRTSREQLPTAADHPRSLFTLLGDHYSMNVHEPVTRLCPEHLCGPSRRVPQVERLKSLVQDLSIVSAHRVLPGALDDGLPPVDRAFEGFAEGARDRASRDGAVARKGTSIPAGTLENRPAQFRRFVNRINARAPSRSLHFLHVLLPHHPWQYLPSGQQYSTSGSETLGLSENDSWRDEVLARQGWQRHLLQVGHADRMVRETLDRLREAGQYDDALIVVTADHGSSFESGLPRRDVAHRNIEAIAPVPLFIKAPRQERGRTLSGQVESIDIVPTIADALGIDLPWEAEGRSVLQHVPRSGDGARLPHPDEGNVSVGYEDLVRRRDRLLARQYKLFGSGKDAERWSLGEHSELLGAPTAALRVVRRPRVSVAFDDPGGLVRADPRASLVHAYVTGTIRGAPIASRSVAVAVNGRVEALGALYRRGRETGFSVMVPPNAFRPRASGVELLVPHSGGGVTYLGGTGETAYSVSGNEVKPPDGREVEIRAGTVRGFVDHMAIDDQTARLQGWALDLRAHRPADVLLVVSGTRILGAVRPSLSRDDLRQKYGRWATHSGFVVNIPTTVLRRAVAAGRLRFVAVAGNRAAEPSTVPQVATELTEQARQAVD